MTKKEDYLKMSKEIPGLEAKERGPTEPYPDQVATLKQSEEKYPALVPFATKGRYKFLNKYSTMKVNYRASVDTAKQNYGNLPFGPKTKKAFNAGMDAKPHEAFENKLVVSHEKKWANKWMRGISR